MEWRTIEVGGVKIKVGIDERLGDGQWLLVSVPRDVWTNFTKYKLEFDTRETKNRVIFAARLVPMDVAHETGALPQE